MTNPPLGPWTPDSRENPPETQQAGGNRHPSVNAPRYLVFRTSQTVTTDTVDRWAIAEGCIVRDIREIPACTAVVIDGRTICTDDETHLWVAELIIDSEGVA